MDLIINPSFCKSFYYGLKNLKVHAENTYAQQRELYEETEGWRYRHAGYIGSILKQRPTVWTGRIPCAFWHPGCSRCQILSFIEAISWPVTGDINSWPTSLGKVVIISFLVGWSSRSALEHNGDELGEPTNELDLLIRQKSSRSNHIGNTGHMQASRVCVALYEITAIFCILYC
jgi:hypothetical protein